MADTIALFGEWQTKVSDAIIDLTKVLKSFSDKIAALRLDTELELSDIKKRLLKLEGL